MGITEILETLIKGDSLTEEAAGAAMSAVMAGEWTAAQVAALLTALRCKGETADEIVGAARAMRAHAVKIRPRLPGTIDTCGTGGDRSGSFNISTTSAFVVAGAGVPVAKHGNRTASSLCGSIDLFEKLGVNVMAPPERIGECIRQVGLGVLFARLAHPAMKHAAPVRSELGFRTIFNFLGPLTNPALPDYQLVGVSDARLLETYAQCLQKLGIQRAWVVTGGDGLDELTLTGPSQCLEVTPASITRHDLIPEDADLDRCAYEDLKGGTPDDNAAITRAILEGRDTGPKQRAVLLNAGAAIYVAGKAATLKEGVARARESIQSGKALEILQKLVEFTNQG
ncbi:MAG TPA: anthranilate phosphoribosyltransferase [bacterium]|nr:anthranilate phosphoribosyltransferase [Candidatus Omnitrophota bacterium]HOJ62440.1 anthranilate phosphoribosyltransferase [bacterium]HOL93104.1 anthranilate phosphoribosyltransferase [bacterium]HPP02462.1 anthranilate phosphoribosyltransferase [bacterium]HXK95783.1 anthranilate phosphoribosyltransferase [bacterium]